MMQQFATSSSKLAVLSFDANVNKSFSQANDSSPKENRSAFEKAFVDAEQSAFVKSKNLAEGSKFFEEQVHQQPVIREPAKPDSSAKREDSQAAGGFASASEHEVNRDVTNASSNGSSDNASSQDDTPEIAILVDDTKQASANGSENEADSEEGIILVGNEPNASESPANKISPEAQLNGVLDDSFGANNGTNAAANAGTHAGTDEQADVFDYVNFVTSVHGFNNDASELTLNDAQDLNGIHGHEFGDMELSAEKHHLAEDLFDTSIEHLNAPQIQQVQDFASISLSEEELQVILDAQNAGVDLNDLLSDEQLAKLNDLLSKMLNQFHQSEGQELEQKRSATIANEAAENAEESIRTLDLSLLQTLIAQSSSEAKQQQAQDALDTKSAMSAEEVLTQQVDAQKRDSSAVSLLSDKGLDNQEAHSKSLLPSSGSENAQKPTNSLTQLALLDERSQTNVLENIKQRTEKFVAELSGNASKGSEFVAALQSGLKEFKEQLQSGREPGIDIKALVSDALTEANVEVLPRNQAKLDSLGNQITSLMNLANAVTQSSAAQAQQVYQSAEGQIIKESAVLNAEGTKLAQANQAAVDKAINIFKPEGQQQLAEKVRWMINGRNPAAEIRLDPPELGAMQIRLSMAADTASVSFIVQSLAAKEALDQAAPRLREMLQQQGVELGQSSVEQQSSGQTEQQFTQQDESDTAGNTSSNTSGDSNNNSNNSTDEEELNNGAVIEQRLAGSSIGGIDYYA